MIRKDFVTFREIESKGGLISSEIVDMEDEFFGEVLFAPPNNPTNASINEAILVPTDIDTLHQGKTEIPLQVRVKKRSYKSATCCIDMNRSVPSI